MPICFAAILTTQGKSAPEGKLGPAPNTNVQSPKRLKTPDTSRCCLSQVANHGCISTKEGRSTIMASKDKEKKIKSRKHLARQQREARQTRIIIIVTIVIGALILGLVGYGLVDQLIVRPRKPVAQVGDEIIRVNEFASQVQYTRVQMLNQTYQYYSFYQQFGQFGESFLQTAQSVASQLSQPVALGREVLDEMIDNILIREAAAERGITASEGEIDEALQSAFGFFPNGTPTPTQTATIVNTPTLSTTSLALVTLTPSPTATELPTETPEATQTPSEFVEGVEETENTKAAEDKTQGEATTNEVDLTPTPELSPTITLTPTPFTTEIYGQNLKDFNELYNPYDYDLEDLRALFETQILREKLQEEVTADLLPVKEEVWARHILVETKEEAQEVLDALEAGEDFHELAAAYSMDESNNQKGGDLGWFDKETMVPEFAEVAFSLEVGEISAPVETNFGFHIIQVLGKRESQIPPDEFEITKQEAFQNWLSEQRNAREDIVIYDEWEDYVPTSPEIPQQFLIQLYQQQQESVPPTAP
jgi:parvulin-like peptidyl-prolyl isomerase